MKRIRIVLLSLLASLFVVSCSNSLTYKNSLHISELPSKLTYNIGDYFTLKGIKVIDDGGIEIYDYVSSIDEGYIFPNKGEYTVTISKTGFNPDNFKITVNDTIDKSLNVYTYPNKTEYKVNERLDLTGLVIKDNNGVTVGGYTTSIEAGTALTKVGINTINVSKLGYKSTSFEITVEEVVSTKLVVNKLPEKLTYNLNERLSLKGLEITCQNQVILDYRTSLNEGDILSNPGNIQILVSKEGFESTTFSIFVNNSSPVDEEIDITFNYLNDTHGAFNRQNTDSNPYETGMSYLSAYYKANKNNNTILLSGGDMFQGGWESNQTRGLIMADAMNIMGFDAMVLGNHEYDWGEPALIQIANTLNCPILACNVFYSSDYVSVPSYLSPYTIISRAGLKIGIIGAVKEGIGNSITGSVSSAFYFPDPIPYVEEYSDLLREQYACDIVIAAFHDGDYDSYYDLLDLSPVSNKQYADGLFLAHDHLRKSGTMVNENRKLPYLEAGKNGTALGEMNFHLEKQNNKYVITDSSSLVNRYIYSDAKEADPEVDKLLIKYKDEIGNPDEVICTFSRSYSKEEFTVLICQAMYWYVNNNKNEFGGVTVYQATHNIGGVRVSSVSEGDFTYANLVTAMPFDNQLCIQTCNYTQIAYMQNSSAYEYYVEEPPVYEGGYTHAVSISYICDNETYGYRCQTSYETYAFTAKEALVLFLKENGDIL